MLGSKQYLEKRLSTNLRKLESLFSEGRISEERIDLITLWQYGKQMLFQAKTSGLIYSFRDSQGLL